MFRCSMATAWHVRFKAIVQNAVERFLFRPDRHHRSAEWVRKLDEAGFRTGSSGLAISACFRPGIGKGHNRDGAAAEQRPPRYAVSVLQSRRDVVASDQAFNPRHRCGREASRPPRPR